MAVASRIPIHGIRPPQYSGCYRLGVWPDSNLATDDRSLQFQPSGVGRLGSPTEETDACFIVRDANGQALAYVVYFEEEPGRRSAARLLTRRRGKAHRQAAGAAKVLETGCERTHASLVETSQPRKKQRDE